MPCGLCGPISRVWTVSPSINSRAFPQDLPPRAPVGAISPGAASAAPAPDVSAWARTHFPHQPFRGVLLTACFALLLMGRWVDLPLIGAIKSLCHRWSRKCGVVKEVWDYLAIWARARCKLFAVPWVYVVSLVALAQELGCPRRARFGRPARGACSY